MTQEARGTPIKVSEYKFKQSLQRSTLSTLTWTTILTSGSTVCRILDRIKKKSEVSSYSQFTLLTFTLALRLGYFVLFLFLFFFCYFTVSWFSFYTPANKTMVCMRFFFFFRRMWLPSLWLQPASVSVKLLDISKGDLGTISTQVCGSKKQISLTRSWNISSLVCGRNIYF